MFCLSPRRCVLLKDFGRREMKPSTASDARVRRTSVIISVIGVTASVLIFCFNGPDSGDPSDFRPDDSKIYVREVEKFGGQGELLLRDLNDEFISIWHGRRLAFTILVLTGAAVWVYRFFALPVPAIDDRP
jgi:hypothetical protein